jgi:selenocysteine lyase/cysteine desulfurase
MSIQAFGAALSVFHEVGVDKIEARIMRLGDKILAELNKRNFKVLNSVIPEERSGVISFSGDMDLKKLSGFMAENQVSLTARDGMVRLSPHFYNSENEIDRFFDLLDRFRKTS